MPATKSSSAKTLKKALPTAKSVTVRSTSAKTMSAAELSRDMLAYGSRVATTKQSALAFLKRIGAPVKKAA